LRLLLLKVASIWDYLRSISTVTRGLIRGNAGLLLHRITDLLMLFGSVVVIVAVVNGHAIGIRNLVIAVLLIQDAVVLDGLDDVVILY
jgi:hypothetical protein